MSLRIWFEFRAARANWSALVRPAGAGTLSEAARMNMGCSTRLDDVLRPSVNRTELPGEHPHRAEARLVADPEGQGGDLLLDGDRGAQARRFSGHCASALAVAVRAAVAPAR